MIKEDQPNRQSEDFSLKVKRYKANGIPTCGTNFESGDVCIFYQTQLFAARETCFFAEHSGTKSYPETLERTNNGKGYLIPLRNCPIWGTEKEIDNDKSSLSHDR